MWIWISLLFWITLPALSCASDSEKADERSRASTYNAFFNGESLTWDQLQVVAKDAGMNPNRLREVTLKERAIRLIKKYKLPLEVSGFAGGMPPNEEFRFVLGSTPTIGALEFNSDFWDKNPTIYDDDAYLSYLLFRADAFFVYRNRYDPEHCTWIVREESEPLNSSFSILRAALNDSADAQDPQTPPTERDLEFRRTLEPSGDSVATLRKLIEFSLRCIAQKAADNSAEETYQKLLGAPPPAVLDRITVRERILASDFGRARFAMTLPERMTFHRILKSPFRYVAIPDPTAPK